MFGELAGLEASLSSQLGLLRESYRDYFDPAVSSVAESLSRVAFLVKDESYSREEEKRVILVRDSSTLAKESDVVELPNGTGKSG